VIRLSPAARNQPISIARAQAYEAAAPLAGWTLLPTDPSLEHDTAFLPADTGPTPDGAMAVVLIGATPTEIGEWLRSGHGVIADGIWSQDPDAAEQVSRIAAGHRQPLLQGDELLHAPVLAGALTEASDIGLITSFETRCLLPTGLLPTGLHTVEQLCEIHGPGVLMRALLGLEMLMPTTCRAVWDSAQVVRQGPTVPGPDASTQSTLTWRGRVLNTKDEAITRVSVVLGTHRGRSVIHDLQMSSAAGVVRAELMPSPSMEVNGESILIPPATHSPAQLEWFGMIPMLKLMHRAVTQRSQPRTGANLLAEALRLIAWASAGGGDPFR